jgi:hypothetical protein
MTPALAICVCPATAGRAVLQRQFRDPGSFIDAERVIRNQDRDVAGRLRQRAFDVRGLVRHTGDVMVDSGLLARELLPDRAQRLGGRVRVRAERPALQAYS